MSDEQAALLERLDTLIAATRAQNPHRWVDAAGVAELLGFSVGHVQTRVICRPNFPEPLCIDGIGHPRWEVSEVLAWAKAERERTVRPARKPRRRQ